MRESWPIFAVKTVSTWVVEQPTLIKGSCRPAFPRGRRMFDSKPGHILELEIIRGQAQQRHRRVETTAFLIGASCECDLVLAAPRFPEVYACLIVRPSGVRVRQFGDGPVLLVNNQPATDDRLVNGDRLVAGPYEFVVHVGRFAGTDEVNAAALASPSATRWTTSERVGDGTALRAAAKLFEDIRTALEEQRYAIRRPA
jgi:Inner membrane component of T3SS, cytoplasmic domain